MATKPRLLDWLMLTYAIALVSAPHALIAGVFTNAALTLLSLFPTGFFFVALVAIVARSIIPALRIDFGHSLERWMTLAFLLVCLSMYYGVAPDLFGFQFTLRKAVSVLPMYIPVLALAYAVIALFLGWRIGPRSRKTSQE